MTLRDVLLTQPSRIRQTGWKPDHYLSVEMTGIGRGFYHSHYIENNSWEFSFFELVASDWEEVAYTDTLCSMCGSNAYDCDGQCIFDGGESQ
jgi:hypothetical protein